MSRIDLPHDGWVVIADGSKALFLRNEGDEKYPNLQVFREMEQENPPTHEQGTDRPGRFPDGTGAHRSAVQETDWHRFNEEQFAKEIADKLYELAHKGRFTKLVLAAAPQTLGAMRKELRKEVAGRVIAEIDKTLTNHPVDEIERLVLGS